MAFIGVKVLQFDKEKKIIDLEFLYGLENFVKFDDQDKYNLIGVVFEYQ